MTIIAPKRRRGAVSVVEEFQKVIDAYRALGYDDAHVGNDMVRDFLEEYTGLESFMNRGERESEDRYEARVRKVLTELTPLVGDIPERELSGYFHYAYMDACYYVGDYSRPEELAQSIGNFILNGIPVGVGGYFKHEDNREVTLDFLLESAPHYVDSIISYLKDVIKEVDDPEYKTPLKQLKDALATGTPGASRQAAESSGLALLASSGTETVAQAFSNNSKLIKHLTTYVPAALDLKYITNLWGSVEPEKGEDAIIFTNLHLLLVAKGFGGWLDGGTSEDAYIPNQNIDHLSLGTAHHVQYSGFTSSDSSYWTLAIVTTDGAVYERYIALGSGEKQINEARQRLTHTFEYLANFFTVTVDGGHAESSDGYTTTMSYGVWNSF